MPKRWTEPADIYSTFFMPLRFGALAEAMGVKESTFGCWIRGKRNMPPDKRRHFASIIDSRLREASQVAGRLIYEADTFRPRRRSVNGNPLARAWHKPGTSPKIKHPATPAKL